MRTKTTLAVRLVTRVTRVTRVDSPKTLTNDSLSVFQTLLSPLHYSLFFFFIWLPFNENEMGTMIYVVEGTCPNTIFLGEQTFYGDKRKDIK